MESLSLEPSQYYPVVLSRFRACLEALGSAAAARNVLMADVRDTLFQGDPCAPSALPAPRESAHEPGAALPYVLFTEEGDAVYHSTLRSDPYDQAWVRAVLACANAVTSALPPALFAPHARVGVLSMHCQAAEKGDIMCRHTLLLGCGCSEDRHSSAGTILGGRNASMAYLQLVTVFAHFTAKESCLAFGVDQVRPGCGCATAAHTELELSASCSPALQQLNAL